MRWRPKIQTLPWARSTDWIGYPNPGYADPRAPGGYTTGGSAMSRGKSRRASRFNRSGPKRETMQDKSIWECAWQRFNKR